MKRIISNDILVDENTIRVVMFWEPIFYEDSEIFAATSFDPKKHRYHTDVNPSRIINKCLSEDGEELEQPLKGEWESFIKDCKWLVETVGFTIIKSYRSEVSKKSEYVIVFGINDTPCGKVIYDLRISDHTIDDLSFPQEVKDMVMEYLKVNKVLDGSATEAGIDFKISQVLVGGVKNDTWDRAFNRLHNVLRKMKSSVQVKLKS